MICSTLAFELAATNAHREATLHCSSAVLDHFVLRVNVWLCSREVLLRHIVDNICLSWMGCFGQGGRHATARRKTPLMMLMMMMMMMMMMMLMMMLVVVMMMIRMVTRLTVVIRSRHFPMRTLACSKSCITPFA